MSTEITWRSGATYGMALSKLKKTRKLQQPIETAGSAIDWALLPKLLPSTPNRCWRLHSSTIWHKENEDARRFEQLHKDDIQFIEQVERVASGTGELDLHEV